LVDRGYTMSHLEPGPSLVTGRLEQAACRTDWIGLSSVLRPHLHSIGYMKDGFYTSEDPTNSIKVLKEQIVHRQIKRTISRHEHKTQQVP